MVAINSNGNYVFASEQAGRQVRYRMSVRLWKIDYVYGIYAYRSAQRKEKST